MPTSSYHVNQRLSLRSQLCTVRFIGEVSAKQGTWLGVEWDDDTRGKNDGKHEGVRYFECRSKSTTAASFIRPDQTWDPPLTFLEALSQKYFQQDQARSGEIIFISRSKQMEEVGFEKFARRQAELKGIKTVVLDQWCISYKTGQSDGESILKTCSHITDLDIRSNLFENWQDILDLCSYLPALRRLSVEGNRFLVSDTISARLPTVGSLNLSNTLLNEIEVSQCLASAPNLRELLFANNSIVSWSDVHLTETLQTVDVSHNNVTVLGDIKHVLKLPSIVSIKIQHNSVKSIWHDDSRGQILSTTLNDLDLGHNEIENWQFFDDLRVALPLLRHLRIAGNPIFKDLCSADNKSLTTADGYMLVIARLPQLQTLNYSTISEKERLNAEKYYLSQIALQVMISEPSKETEILQRHPLWSSLCNEYGEPEIDHVSQSNTIDPKSLAARLVKVEFFTSLTESRQEKQWTARLPKSFNLYAIHGIVGKVLHTMPLKLKLILETDENDPLGKITTSSEAEWWDSDDENDDDGQDTWIKREIELPPSTRSLATYLNGEQAKIRIERRDV